MSERQLGIVAFREGRLRESVDRLRLAAADHERTVMQAVGFQTYAYLGAALYALGDASEAAQMFTTAVTLHAGATPPLDILINLANAYLAAGMRHDAEQTLVRALSDNPGAMEARLMLERLRSRGESVPITGAVFGESVGSVQKYMETLSFSASPQGYSPEEVRAALAQINQYLGTLAGRLAEKDQSIAAQSAEIQRLSRTEETLIENMIQSRQEAERLRSSVEMPMTASIPTGNGLGGATTSENDELTPLERLFQKKP